MMTDNKGKLVFQLPDDVFENAWNRRGDTPTAIERTDLCRCGHRESSHPFDKDDPYEDGHCIVCDCPPYGFVPVYRLFTVRSHYSEP